MPEGPSQCSVRLRGLTDGISRSHRVVAFANAFRPTSNPADSYSVVFEEEEDADGSFGAGRATVAAGAEGADDGMQVDSVEAGGSGAAPGMGGGRGARVRQFRKRKQDEEGGAS